MGNTDIHAYRQRVMMSNEGEVKLNLHIRILKCTRFHIDMTNHEGGQDNF